MLLVDDDEGIRDALAEFLNTLEFGVVTAENGEEALSKFGRGDFEIVLADLMMPKLDGMELLNRIREVDEDVIFLMITGHPSIGTAVESINRGADDYITKPFHLEDVKLRIEKALEKRSLKSRLKTAQGLAWGLMLSIPLWLLLGIILVILIKG
ncbi:MAG: response regulator [Nitrospirales bacterium]